MANNKLFKVFYKDYVNDVSIKSSEPGELSGDRIAPLAEVLLQHADNFLGIYDGKDTLLQAYLDDDEQTVFLELQYHEQQGCLQLKLPWADAFDILASLPAEFGDELLPDAKYIG